MCSLQERCAADGESAVDDGLAESRLALERLTLALQRIESATRPASAAEDGHSHGGMLAVDLDEAVHGLYTAVAYINKAGANGIRDVGASLQREADLWVVHPGQWMANTTIPHGPADIGISALVAVALVPFALLALHAGIGEVQHANTHYLMLEDRLDARRAFHAVLHRTIDALCARSGDTAARKCALLVAMRRVCAQEMESLECAMRDCRLNLRIGQASAVSGGAIAVKASLDLGAKVTYLATAGTAVGTGVATAIGTLGTLALGPAAAVGAVALGTAMAVKSHRIAKQFNVDRDLTRRHIGSTEPTAHAKKNVAAYRTFIGLKLDQRKAFNDSYASDNKRFLGGSAVYAVSVLLSAGLTIAALLTFGVAVGMFGFGAIIVLGAAGGLVMGRYSAQFFVGHGRQHRYEGYALADDDELDRPFLGGIEAYGAGYGSIAPSAGLTLRAHYFSQASQRDRLRQTFLAETARGAKKRYDGACNHSTDADVLAGQTVMHSGAFAIAGRQLRKKSERARGNWRAVGSYFSALRSGDGHKNAVNAAALARRQAKPYLDVATLRNCLPQAGCRTAQFDMMRACMAAQIDYLKEKTALRLSLYALGNDLPLQPPSPATAAPTDRRQSLASIEKEITKSTTQQTAHVLDAIAEPLVRDMLIYGQAKSLWQAMERTATGADDAGDAALAAMIFGFIALQRGEIRYTDERLARPSGTVQTDAETQSRLHRLPPDLFEADTAFADYCLKDAPERHRMLRGVMMAVEIQAAGMAQHIASVADEPPTAVAVAAA